MIRVLYYIVSLVVAVAASAGDLSAQSLPERGEVRRGNGIFATEDYVTAAEHYTKALEYAPSTFEAKFNLGCAVAKVDSLADAAKIFEELAADSLLSDAQRAMSYYNLGNTQFGEQKLQEALESYKNAMRFDPADAEAKYNYAYTKSLLDQQQDQNQDQDQQNDDQNKDDQQQDQNQDQDQQNDDQNEDDQQQNQDQNQDQQDQGDQEDEQQQQPQPQDGEISQQEREQMLDAIQAQEDKTQDDLKERARGVVIQGAKNW